VAAAEAQCRCRGEKNSGGTHASLRRGYSVVIAWFWPTLVEKKARTSIHRPHHPTVPDDAKMSPFLTRFSSPQFDQELELDPERATPFEEIRPFLFRLLAPKSRKALCRLFMTQIGVPLAVRASSQHPVSAEMVFTSEVPGTKMWRSHPEKEDDEGLSGVAARLGSMLMRGGSACGWGSVPGGREGMPEHSNPAGFDGGHGRDEFAKRAVGLLMSRFSGDMDLAAAALMFSGKSSTCKKTAKALLKRRPTHLGLWAAYAR
jgi:hypothetical protein